MHEDFKFLLLELWADELENRALAETRTTHLRHGIHMAQNCFQIRILGYANPKSNHSSGVFQEIYYVRHRRNRPHLRRITLSIWFSNWNDRKKEREIEINVLKELRQGLVHDSSDVQYNIRMRERARAACEKIISFMESPPVYHDSLGVNFAAAFQIAATANQTSAYENLKSRGLHTISNDSLRKKIIDLFDLSYTHIHESESRHGDLFFNFLVHFNASRFDSPHPYRAMKPLNYPALMKDGEYEYYLRVLIFYNDYILNESRDILKNISALISAIDEELARLE